MLSATFFSRLLMRFFCINLRSFSVLLYYFQAIFGGDRKSNLHTSRNFNICCQLEQACSGVNLFTKLELNPNVKTIGGRKTNKWTDQEECEGRQHHSHCSPTFPLLNRAQWALEAPNFYQFSKRFILINKKYSLTSFDSILPNVDPNETVPQQQLPVHS